MGVAALHVAEDGRENVVIRNTPSGSCFPRFGQIVCRIAQQVAVALHDVAFVDGIYVAIGIGVIALQQERPIIQFITEGQPGHDHGFVMVFSFCCQTVVDAQALIEQRQQQFRTEGVVAVAVQLL